MIDFKDRFPFLKMKGLASIFSFLILIWAVYAEDNRQIKGRVSDQEGKPLADVKVKVLDSRFATQSSSDGTFIIEDLAPRKYLILFTHPDYLPQSMEVLIDGTREETIHVTLAPKNPMLLTLKEEITVTAEADSIIDVNLPSHRTILPSSVLSELGTANVAESVEKVPGVSLVGMGGYSMAPAIRGLAEHRILLLVDGMPVTSERRIGASASFISLDDIDRIEINRGPYSVFHGSGAVGGIINIITKSPSPNAPLRGNLWLSYNTARQERSGSFHLSGSHGNLGFLFGVDGKKASDYSSPRGKVEYSRYSDYDLLFKVNRDSGRSQVFLSFLYYQGLDIGKPSPSARFKPRWYPSEKNVILTAGYKMKDTFHFDSLQVLFYLLRSSLETRMNSLDKDLSLKKSGESLVEGTNYGLKIRADRGWGKSHDFRLGLDFFGRRGLNDQNQEWIFDPAGNIVQSIKEISLLGASSQNFGLFVDDKISFSSALNLNLGARFDYIRASNGRISQGRIKRDNHSLTAYAGSVYQLNHHLSLLVNLGRSFRFPSLSELFYSGLTGRGVVFGSPDLSPEKGLNFDFGLRYLHQRLYGSVYGFVNTISGMIEKYGGENDEYYYQNLSRGRITGVEGEFYFPIVKNLEMFINFHHLKGREVSSRSPLNHVPASRLVIWTKYSSGRFWLEPKLTLVSAKKDHGPLEKEVKSYSLLDAILGYRFSPNVALLAVAQNLFNQTYYPSADSEGVEASGRGAVFKINCSF